MVTIVTSLLSVVETFVMSESASFQCRSNSGSVVKRPIWKVSKRNEATLIFRIVCTEESAIDSRDSANRMHKRLVPLLLWSIACVMNKPKEE